MKQQTESKSILEMPVNSRAIVYSRVSTDDQAERGTGLDGQERENLAYAESIGATVVAQFREDYTGTTLDRPELAKARAMLRAGQADMLIAHRPDRLDRSEWGVNLMIFLRELKSLDIELHYSQQRRRIDLNNAPEALMQTILGWQAGEDRTGTVRRLSAGRIEKVRQGSVMVSGRPAYGYDAVKDEAENGRTHYRLAINEEEAAIVRKFFEWSIYGDETGKPLGGGAITAKINGMGVLTKGDKNPNYRCKQSGRGRWNQSTVTAILRNRLYIGEWKFKPRGEKPIIVEVPPIISREIFDLAQSRVQGRSNNTKKHSYLLSGRVTCDCCNYAMFGNRIAEGRAYYRSPALANTKARKCDSGYFRVKKVDAAVWGWLTGIFTDPTGESLKDGLIGFRKMTQKKSGPLKQELEMAKTTAQEVEQRLEGLYRDFQQAGSDWLKKRIEGDMTILEQQLKGTQATIDRLAEQLREITVTPEEEVRLLEFAATMRGNWSEISKDIESQQAILNRFNIRVRLKKDNHRKLAIVTGKLIPGEKTIAVEPLTSGCQGSIRSLVGD